VADDDARALVDRITADLAPLEARVNEAWWVTNVASSPEADAARIALEQELSDYYADAETYEALKKLGDVEDPDLRSVGRDADARVRRGADAGRAAQ
jgi:hypothetical protein